MYSGNRQYQRRIESVSIIRTTSKKSAALKVILSSISDAYYEIDREGKLVFFNFKAMVEVNPDVQVVLTSGFTEHEVGKIFTEQNLVKFLQKPYRPVELQEVVQAVIGAAAETQVQLDL